MGRGPGRRACSPRCCLSDTTGATPWPPLPSTHPSPHGTEVSTGPRVAGSLGEKHWVRGQETWPWSRLCTERPLDLGEAMSRLWPQFRCVQDVGELHSSYSAHVYAPGWNQAFLPNAGGILRSEIKEGFSAKVVLEL